MAPLTGCASEPEVGAVRASTGSGPALATCLTYAYDQQQQLHAFDLRLATVDPIGSRLPLHVGGLAIHPESRVIYVIGRAGGPLSANGVLYSVDATTGEAIRIGDTGHRAPTALAFRSDGTLWSWAQDGLIEIDPADARSTLMLASTRPMDGLAWSPDGRTLRGTRARALYEIEIARGVLTPMAGARLPAAAKAITARTDGFWLGASGAGGSLALFLFDPTTGATTPWAVPPGPTLLNAIAWPDACGLPSPGGRADLIQNIVLAPSSVCAGDSITVTVTAAHPHNPTLPVTVVIDEKVGDTQFVQAHGAPGPRLLSVAVSTSDHYIDDQTVSYQVVACPGRAPMPIVYVAPSVFHTGEVEFRVSNAAELGTALAYAWDFGDGEVATTTVPFISHPYSPVMLGPDALYTTLAASVTVSGAGVPPRTTPKTVSISNQYAFSKQAGWLAPPVTYDPAPEITVFGLVRLPMRIRNLEDEEVRFAHAKVEFRPCDADGVASDYFDGDHTVLVPAHDEVEDAFTLSVGDIPPGTCGVNVHLDGGAASGLPAYASAYFSVQNEALESEVTDPALLSALGEVASRGLVPDIRRVTDEDLHRLSAEGQIAEVLRVQSAIAPDHADPPGPLGDACVPPGAPGEVLPPMPGLVCRPSGHWDETGPAVVANARAGDIVVSAGCGAIGSLLRQVSPPQRFTHTGMVTRSFYEVTHSTSVEGRYADYAEGGGDPTEGFDEDVMRFGWPGIITQTVGDAYASSTFLDPEGRPYAIGAFNENPVRCVGDAGLNWPLVIKPPLAFDADVRPFLTPTAARFRNREFVTGHYRFFGYSDGSVAADDAFDGGPGREFATVCSSAIWAMFNGRGDYFIALEGSALEVADIVRGAQRDPTTMNGLYFYSAEERAIAARFLYASYYDQAYYRAGWFAVATTDIADDVANQVVNCFANDGCAPAFKDRTDWEDAPSAGRAVSPDDMLFWDAPSTGGLYGFHQGVVFRPSSYRARFAWTAESGTGSIRGVVLNPDRTPASNATVVLSGGAEMVADASGNFAFAMVPAGPQLLIASRLDPGADPADPIDDRFFEGRADAVVADGVETVAEIVLEAPLAARRLIQIDGAMHLVDDEADGPDVPRDVTVSGAVMVSPIVRQDRIRFSACVGEEVRLDVTYEVTLQADDRTVRVVGIAKLFEGTDCTTTDLEDTATIEHLVEPDGAPVRSSMRVENGSAWGGVTDNGTIDVFIANLPAPL